MPEYTGDPDEAEKRGVVFWNQLPAPEVLTAPGGFCAPATGVYSVFLGPPWLRPINPFLHVRWNDLVAPRLTAALRREKRIRHEIGWRTRTAWDALVHGT